MVANEQRTTRVMSDDDQPKPLHATARPPAGEEDVYSASTVVGEASDEILAIIRQSGQDNAGAKGAIPGAPKVPTDLGIETSEPKRELSNPAANIPTPAAGSLAYEPAALDAATAKNDVGSRSASTTAAARTGGLPPAVGIILFFAIVAVVLAALIR
jgi:hypothetical protein